MKVLLTTLNAKYIHTNLALRWLYVARDPKFDVLIKEFTIRDYLEDIVLQINEIKPDIIGLSIYIWNNEESKRLVLLIKELLPNVRIIIGGPEVSYEVDDWLDYPIECILQGEGEKIFWQACRNETNIDGYVSSKYQSDTKYAKVEIDWLETLESPYFLEMDNEQRKNRYLYIETSRGCPYQCSYCLSSLDRKVRMFSNEYIIKQLKMLELYDCKQVKFLDRTFNVHPQRALLIAQTIEQLNVNFSFQFEIVADTLNEELLEFFENSNKDRYRFEVGVQSFNKKTLDAVSRYQDLDKLITNIKRLHQAGCLLHVDLIGGLPYEDLSSFKESFTKLYSCHSGEIQVGLLKLLKGTRLKNQSDEFGFMFEENAPYTIMQTKWLSQNDVMIIQDVYHAVEKLYNNQKASETLDYCFDKGYPIFDIFASVGAKIRANKSQIQVDSLFMFLYESLSEYKILKDNILKALINNDYYMHFKQVPKNLFLDDLDKATIRSLSKQWVQHSMFDEYELYNYGKIKYGLHNNKIAYQVLFYNSQHTKPKRVWVEI